eukprot:TRINITY_DN35272_c0_g1_i1.p1 TRINITY_DN35272_c0_g1~~TRINITY_DN35272_c0_g1_i1.p1  ORF type:complete len:431 (+),score=69.57 TRINITY_DN35272_c0_g1_i1:116-1408(+)
MATEGDFDEKKPLLKPRDDTADATALKLKFAVLLFIPSIISGSYYYSDLFPAWEADRGLGWLPHNTTMISSVVALAEALGTLVGGTAGDHLPARPFMAMIGGAMVLSTMLISSLVIRPPAMIAIIAIGIFIKGMLWPFVGSWVAEVLSRRETDSTFLLMALASRLGGVFHSALLGTAMVALRLSWRHAAQCLCVAICIGLFAVSILMNRLEAKPARDSNPSLGGLWRKLKRLCTSKESWLTFLILVGSYSVWALLAYMSVILRDVLKIPVGAAAGKVAIFNAGAALGLVVNSLIAAYFKDVARSFQKGVVLLGAGVLAVLAHDLYSLSHSVVLALFGLVGFCFVVASYLPILAYGAMARAEERAFRIGVLDGAASLTQVLIIYTYGHRRVTHPDDYASWIMACSSGGLATAGVAMHFLYKSLDAVEDAAS